MNSRQHEPRAGERILVVSPAKDEEEFIGQTIHSLAWQTLRPATWIIVNDGSRDRTGEIAEQAAREFPWIKVVHLSHRNQRRVGPGVVEAFYAGLDTVDLGSYDFVCKLDADIHLPHFYFSGLVAKFQEDHRLGTISGKCYIPVNGRLVLERTGDEFTHGVAKLYRRECFEAIGGFVHSVMWDGIDCHRCRMRGWRATSIVDPRFAIIHLRQMGASHKNVLHGRRRWGRGQHYMGTHWAYALAITLYRMAERPWIIGGLNILWGYLWAQLTRRPRYEDLEFRRHLRKWQWNKLSRLLFPTSIVRCYRKETPDDVTAKRIAEQSAPSTHEEETGRQDESRSSDDLRATEIPSAVPGTALKISLDGELAGSRV